MKRKCIVCHKALGKRGCIQYEMALVCPKCCANIRNVSCGGCSYYQAAEKYDTEKFYKSGGKSFAIELNEEAEEAVGKALSLIESKKLKKAEQILSDLNITHPDYHMVHYGMGALCAFNGQEEKAITHFKEALKSFPYLTEAHYNLGIAYKKKFDIPNMVKYFRKAMDLSDPEDFIYHQAKEMLDSLEREIQKSYHTDLDTHIKAQEQFAVGVKLMVKGEYEKAIHAFRASERICSSLPALYGNIGLCHAYLGRKMPALAALDKALELDPTYEPAMVNKTIVESLEDGDTGGLDLQIIEYYKDFPMKNRSYIQHYLEERMGNPKKPRQDESNN
ncbi:MAG: hypothetical protein JEZ11_01660 [Desulfobacterales bacterium]|nr:hypothetical protein [Desulfobacterales bacterium]